MAEGELDTLTAASLLVGRLGGGEVVERPRHDIEVLALFDRCRSLLGAIRLLLANNFVHEAVMLGRPLFSDSLMLAEYAASDETRRAELVVGWMMASLADLEGLYRDASSRGDDVAEELAGLAQRRAEIATYARRHGVGTKSWRPDDHAKELAFKHGRGDEYPALLVTHHFVHGTTMAASQRYSKVAKDTAAVGGPAAQLEPWALDAGLFAAYSTLLAGRAICVVFGWEEPPELDQLVRRIEQVLEDRGEASG